MNDAIPIPYDVALRKRAVMAYERGEGSHAQLAALFEVAPRTLERWVERWRTACSVEPRPRGGGRRSPIDLEALRARESPDATIAEMCAEYNRRARRAQRTTTARFQRALVREEFVIKTNARGRAKPTGRMWSRSAAPS